MARTRFRLACTVLLLALLVAVYGLWRYLAPALPAAQFEHRAANLLERSRQALLRARPTYQQEVLATLAPNPINGDFFRLDDMAGQADVSTGTYLEAASKSPKIVLSYEFDDPADPSLTPVESLSSVAVAEGMLTIQHRAPDYLVTELPLAVPRDDVAQILIRARAARGTHMLLGWHGDEPPRNLFRHSLTIDLVPDGAFHTYEVNARTVLRRGLARGDRIRRLLLRPSDLGQDTVEVDFIRLVSNRGRYSERPCGRTYETLADEMRAALYMSAPTTARYSVRVPPTAPELAFGIGLLDRAAPVEFVVSIGQGGALREIFRQTVEEPDVWRDFTLDLSSWADQDVEITLAVEGPVPQVALWSSPILRSAPRRRFNVIMVLEDTLRADHLSAYGHDLPTSPVREQVANRGILFEKAVSQATKTRPSVASLMTSLLPTATGVWTHSDYLHENYLTLAEILRAQGFVTASFLQNGNAGPYAGLHQGFDAVFDEDLFGWTSDALIGPNLLAWLERHHTMNFFLYLHLADPHGPYDPPSPYDGWYREGQGQGMPVEKDRAFDPPWVETPTDRGRRALYDGEISHNDSILAGFVDQLRRLDLWEETLLVLLSDHGEHLGERQLWGHHPPGYLNVTHVPLIMVYPPRLAAGRRVAETVQLLDLMPTILELAEVDRSDLFFQGDSLLDLIEARRKIDWSNRVAVSEEATVMNRGAPCGCGSLFFGNWHLIDSRSFSGPRGLRVFHLTDDREEVRPLFPLLTRWYLQPRFHRVVIRLQTTGIQARNQWSPWKSEVVPQDPETQDRLKALGYIQ